MLITAYSVGEAQEQFFQMVCKSGNINFFGSLPKDKSVIQFDSNIIHYKECYVSGTEGSAPLQNKTALSIIASGKIDIKKYIIYRLPLTALLNGLEKVEKVESLKVMITPYGK